MKASTAQEAAEAFRVFLMEFAEAIESSPTTDPGWVFRPAALVSDKAWQAIPGAFVYLTDWLQAWCLSGKGVSATRGEYTEYLQAVTIVLADAHRAVFKKLAKSIFPPANDAPLTRFPSGHNMFQSSPASIVPIAIAPEFYATCTRLDQDQRSRALRNLINRPGTARYFCPAPDSSSGFNTEWHH